MPQMTDSVEQVDAPRRHASDATLAGRRRFAFFGLAALWGYVLGIGVLAAALSQDEIRVALHGRTLAWLAIGSLVGLAGGMIVASAYREARRRHRF